MKKRREVQRPHDVDMEALEGVVGGFGDYTGNYFCDAIGVGGTVLGAAAFGPVGGGAMGLGLKAACNWTSGLGGGGGDFGFGDMP